MDFDDFDPDYHTPEEIAAHAEERLSELEWEYENNPAFRARVDELKEMSANMNTQQRGLEQLQHDDPVGLVWFGEDDDWVDSRLSRNTPK
jgi:hypothetical protein